MKKIQLGELTITETAAWVAEHLRAKGIESFLSGGAVVSIYTDNRYESFDLDFVSFSDRSRINAAMEELGFRKNKSRYYVHPDTRYFVEFPGAALRVGNSLVTITEEIKTEVGTLKLLTATDCVKDRLAAFYHWNDLQGLDQALWVAQSQPVDLEDIKKWSKQEGKATEFNEFQSRLENK